MTCPYHSDDEAQSDQSATEQPDEGQNDSRGDSESSGINRRSFVKSALAIGGIGALSTTKGFFGTPNAVAAEPDSVPSYGERLNRQHAWDEYEVHLPNREQTKPPDHHLILLLDYQDNGKPSPGHRKQAERAFDSLEERFGWHHEGVLFTVGYSPAYFDRFRDDDGVVMPPGIDPENGGLNDKQGLVRPEPLIKATAASHEDPDEIAAETADACLHIASDDALTLLHAEEALWGNNEDVSLDATLEGVFDKPTEYPRRRVGFIGHDNLESMDEFDQVETGEGEDGLYPEDIPEEDEYKGKTPDKIHGDVEGPTNPKYEYGEHPNAELSMGFNDLYKNSVPKETNATILEDQQLVEAKPPGVFAQGTIQHVSKLDINIDDWYDNNDLEERRAQMFSPQHTAENTGAVGENLGNSNAPGDKPVRDISAETDVATETVHNAEDYGVAGHVQKLGRARFSLESRITDSGIDTYRGIDRYDAATERHDDLLGHDGKQEAEQVVLRRDFDGASQGDASNHFVALMRFNAYMGYLRAAMNGVNFDTAAFGLTDDARLDHADIKGDVNGDDKDGFVNDDGEGNLDNGIVSYLQTERRGNFLVPPLSVRALPPASAESVDISVTGEDGMYKVDVKGVAPGMIDTDTVRFGFYLDVNRARGASPSDVSQRGGNLTLTFDADSVELGDEDTPRGNRVRLFAKRKNDSAPLQGTTTV